MVAQRRQWPTNGCDGLLPNGQRCGAVLGTRVGERNHPLLHLTSAAVAVHRWPFRPPRVHCRCGKVWTWDGKIQG